MSRVLSLFVLASTLTCPVARAVYAPVPPLERGKALTVYLASGAYYDTNIFGSAENEVDSLVLQLQPSVAFNASLTKQTFASVAYRASLDYMLDRPGTKFVDSHEATARLAHTLNPESEFDLSNTYQISKNPESLLPGVGTLSGDQSFRRNQLDGRFSRSFTRRTGMLLKARSTVYSYENATLSEQLDRSETTAGATFVRAMLPTLKASAEYRYQNISYRTRGDLKDKESHFLVGGADYALNSRIAVSTRLGFEYRLRDGGEDEATPYIELGAKRDYAKGSFISAGYSYSLEETSGVEQYSDIAVNRFFLNWQHVLTPKLVASASAVWEPSQLQGRPGISPDRDETNTRIGVGLTFRPRENWSITANLDVDRIASDEPTRELDRDRLGLTARYAF